MLGTFMGVLLLSLDFEIIDSGHSKYFRNEEMTEWDKSKQAFLADPRVSVCTIVLRLRVESSELHESAGWQKLLLMS